MPRFFGRDWSFGKLFGHDEKDAPSKSSPSKDVVSKPPEQQAAQPVEPSAAAWNRTEVLLRRLEDDPSYSPPKEGAPYGEYNGHRIIGRNSRINGGVYMGAGSREILVVDDTSDDELLVLYAELLRRRMRDVGRSDRVFNQGILQEVFKLVKEKMPNNLSLAREYAVTFRNKEVPLGTFLKLGGGACRHHTMATGYLLEKLGDEGFLQGKVSPDRNEKSDGAHVWARYEYRNGQVYIIDPAQNYIGPLHDPQNPHRWDYLRPEDKQS